jgi:hypothetical protein
MQDQESEGTHELRRSGSMEIRRGASVSHIHRYGISMSALLPTADVDDDGREVRFVPNGDISGDQRPILHGRTHWELLDGNSGTVFLSFAHA